MSGPYRYISKEQKEAVQKAKLCYVAVLGLSCWHPVRVSKQEIIRLLRQDRWTISVSEKGEVGLFRLGYISDELVEYEQNWRSHANIDK